MKIKLDENLPKSAAAALVQLGHDVHTVMEEGLSGSGDSEVWEATQLEERFFVTQDMAFADLRRFAPGKHHGILILRLSEPRRRLMLKRVVDVFQSDLASEFVRALIVVTDNKVRIRKP